VKLHNLTTQSRNWCKYITIITAAQHQAMDTSEMTTLGSYKVWPADAKVDDIGDGLTSKAFPLSTADRLSETSHLMQDTVDIRHHLPTPDTEHHSEICSHQASPTNTRHHLPTPDTQQHNEICSHQASPTNTGHTASQLDYRY